MTAPRATVTVVPYYPAILPGQVVTVAAVLTRMSGGPPVSPGTPLVALGESAGRGGFRVTVTALGDGVAVWSVPREQVTVIDMDRVAVTIGGA